MLSPDLLGILMRGIQARHHDWGMTPEGASLEDDFSALIEGEAGEETVAPHLSAPGEQAALAEAVADEAAVDDTPPLLPAAAAPVAHGIGRAERVANGDLATRPSAAVAPGSAEVRAMRPAADAEAAAEADARTARPAREGRQVEAGPPPAAGSGGASSTLPVQIVAVSGDAPHLWRLEGDGAVMRAVGAAPAPAAGTAGASPAAVAGQVAVAIAGAEGDRIEIRLDPPELGRVRIAMRVVDGALSAVVLAERPEVADMLRRHAGDLERELAAAGYENVSLDFGSGGDDGPDERAAAPLASVLSKGERVSLEILPAAGRGDGRLDIRL
jgi:flagellar hook-length control protein FliK